MLKPESYQFPADPWETLFQAKERGTVLTARVGALDYPDGVPTWILAFPNLDGARGLVPAAEAGVDKSLMRRFVGQDIRVKVKGLDRDSGLVACSRREAVEEARTKLNVRVGQVLECSVRAILPRDRESGKPPRLLVDVGGGVMVEIPEARAALRLSQALNRQYRIGETVAAKVTEVTDDGLPVLSVRHARPDPWACADFRRGSIIAGTVYTVRQTRAGHGRIVYVEPHLTPGLLGIAPVPLVGEVKPGDRVTCAVATFDRASRKLRLRLRGW
ncbi:MAG: 30S ribosomal protein S1 [Bacillota bacterium]